MKLNATGRLGLTALLALAITTPLLADEPVVFQVKTAPRAYLGITMHFVESVHGDGSDDGRNGVYVASVIPGTAAEQAGLQSKDKIVEVDGIDVAEPTDLKRILADARPDQLMNVTVRRNGVDRTLAVYLGESPEKVVGKYKPVVIREIAPEPHAYLGVKLRDLTPQLATYFEVDAGVLVESVVEDSPAALSGLQAGDIVLSIEGTSLDGPSDLKRVMMEQEIGDRIDVQISRRGALQRYTVEVGSSEDMKHELLKLEYEMLEKHHKEKILIERLHGNDE